MELQSLRSGEIAKLCHSSPQREYFVTNQGRIIGRTLAKGIEKVRTPKVTNGYHFVNFWKDGKIANFYIHTLVLEAFVGPRPEGYVACHCDGNQANNTPENLRWDTVKNNIHDKFAHGTMPRGEIGRKLLENS